MSMELSTFKTFLGITKLKANTECLRYFRLQNDPHWVLVKKVLPKHSMVIFSLVYPLEKF